MCEPHWKAALLCSIIFIGQVLTAPFLPAVADKVGRKKVFLAARLLEVVLFPVMLSTRSWVTLLVVNLLFGMLTTGRLTVGIPYMQELYPKARQTGPLSRLMQDQSFIYLACTFFFWKLSKRSVIYLSFAYGVSLTTTGLCFFLPESPRFLFAVGRIKEAKAAIDRIALFNKSPKIDWEAEDLRWAHKIASDAKEASQRREPR